MKKFKRSRISFVGTLILLSAALTPNSLVFLGDDSRYEVNAAESANAADLADVSILKGTQLSSKNGTIVNDGVKLEKNADSTYDLNLSFKGTAVADVGLISPKVIVFAIPEEFRGKIDGPIMINANAKLLPLVPGDIPVVKDLVLNVGGLVTRLLGLAKPLGLKLDSLEKAFEGLNSLQDLGSYHASFEGKLSPDGKYVMVDFTDGLGQYVRTTYANLFNPLKEAVDGLKFTGLLAILNPVLDLLKPVVNSLLDLVGKIANGTSDVLTNALQANVLGDVNFDFSTKVSDVTAEKAKVTAMAVNKPVIDLELLNTIHANGDSLTLYFDNVEENPLVDYPVASPVIEDIVEGMTGLKGQVAISQPVPAGVTFNAKVELPNGATLSGVINEDGTFVVPFGDYQPQGNDQLKIVVEASVGKYTKTSDPIIKQVIADPFLHYVVSKPAINDILEGMPNLDGHVALAKPIPAGVSFTAKVTLPDGTTLTGSVDPDGHFTLPFGKYQPQGDDQLKIVIEASDGNRTKTSEQEIKQVILDPLKNYQVPKPQFKSVNEGSKFITGSIDLANVPYGTKLFVQVQFPDGLLRKVAIENDGTFSIAIADKNLKEGNPLRLVTIAEHPQSFKGKVSDSVVFAVGKIPSLADYVVPAPVVNPIFVGDTMIKGTVKIVNPPEGTSFTVRVRFPGNVYEETPVNADGTFSLDISGRQLAVGTSVTLNTAATLGTEAAASGRVIVSVGAK
ncbi:adhesive domain-containing protein [Enterococcus rotai]|uniref:adhesive domain-containing protein n=1 Tax=Enterococcus rotai TaxID=118060 RepID=UPI0035C6CB0C